MQYSYDADPSKYSSAHLILRNINPIDIILNIIQLAALDKIIGESSLKVMSLKVSDFFEYKK